MRPIRMSSEASRSGLEAVRLQKRDDWHPIAYTSRSMTEIEKELLSITHVCEQSHQFVSGWAISVDTGHKPLNDYPLRIQRTMNRL